MSQNSLWANVVRYIISDVKLGFFILTFIFIFTFIAK